MISRLIRLRVRLIWPEVVAIQVAILLAAALRGLDYLLPPDTKTASTTLSVIEKAAPLDVWSALFLVGGVLGLVGLRVTRWPLASIGHVILLATYAAFAVGSAFEIGSRPWLEGFRTPSDWALVFVVLHWGFADACIDVWRERHNEERVVEHAD